MDRGSLLPGLSRFIAADLPAEPWRNGGGVTRTVAASGEGKPGYWRISLADITQDGSFSLFEGLDRTAVLVRGSRLTLRHPRGHWLFEGPGSLARFPGELPLSCELSTASAQLWNIMAERRQIRADVQVVRTEGSTVGPVSAGALFLLDGTLDVLSSGSDLLSLKAGEGLIFDGWLGSLALRSHEGAGHWIMTTFHAL